MPTPLTLIRQVLRILGMRRPAVRRRRPWEGLAASDESGTEGGKLFTLGDSFLMSNPLGVQESYNHECANSRVRSAEAATYEVFRRCRDLQSYSVRNCFSFGITFSQQLFSATGVNMGRLHV